MFVIIEADENMRGADAIIAVYGVYHTHGEVVDILTSMRDDDPETGNGFTYMEVHNA